jgi:hypothetical protein
MTSQGPKAEHLSRESNPQSAFRIPQFHNTSINSVFPSESNTGPSLER